MEKWAEDWLKYPLLRNQSSNKGAELEARSNLRHVS